MKLVKVQIAPLSAFATKLAGDTLFGQFCSFLAKRDSDFLARALDGYNNGKPFVVFSDAFPSSYIPRAIVPSFFYKKPSDKDRKQQKKLKLGRYTTYRQRYLSVVDKCKRQKNA